MSYLKDREIWLSSVPTGNPPAGYVWVFIQNGVFVVRDSNGVDKIMASTTGTVTNATSASYVEYSNVADKPALISGSSQVSYTGLSDIPSGIVSSSAQVGEYGIFATTGSNQFDGSQAITGSLTVTGEVVAQTLNVQQVTSSIVYSSGSNIFGNDVSNTQQFTGSLQVSGSSHYLLGNVGIGTTSPSTYDAALIGTSHRFFNVQSTSNTYAVTTLAGNQSSANDRIGYLTFVNDNNSSGYKYAAWIGSEVEGATANQLGGRLIFSTTGDASSAGPIERMRITSGGNVLIGTTTDSGYKLDVNGTGTFTGISASPVLTLSNSTGGTKADFTITENTGLIVNSYEGASARSIDFKVGGASALTLASTGAATFSSSVTAASNFILSGNANSFAVASIFRNTNRVFFGGDTGGYFFQNSSNSATILQITDTGAATFTFDNNSSGVVYQRNVSGTIYELGSVKNSGSDILYQGTGNVFINADSNSDSTSSDRNVIFGNRGVEYMRITSGGNVLIGTTTDAGYKLDVNGTQRIGNLPNLSVEDSLFLHGKGITSGGIPYGDYGSIVLGADSSYTTGARRFLITNGYISNRFAIIQSVDANTTPTLGAGGGINSGIIIFSVSNTGTAEFSVPLLGTSAIFSSSVQAATESNIVGTSVNSRMLVTASGVANTVVGFNNSGSTVTGVTNNSAYLGVLQSYPLVFTTNSVERMRITSGGNVGIGTASPAYKFVVSNGGAAGLEVDPVSPTITGGVDLLFYNRSTSAYKGASFIASQFNFSGGNVGINATTISQPSSGATTLRIVGTVTNKAGAIFLDSSDSSVSTYIYPDSTNGLSINTSTSHPIVFRTAAAEKMRITSGGNVGIKNSDPQGLLEVGKVDANSTYGGHFFSTFLVTEGVWTTVFTVPSNLQWNAVTEFTWVSSGDFNRSGAAYMRWAYNAGSANLGVVYTLFNDSQNATGTFRRSGNEIQILITGGSGVVYYVQVRIQGSKAA